MSFPRYEKYKDSGVEWLGDVPEHWSVNQLRRSLDSIDYGISDSLEPDGDIAILRMGNINDGKIIMEDLKYVNSIDPALFLKKGDLLYNRTNSLDLIGKVGMFEGNCKIRVSFASYLVRLRSSADCVPEYLAYMLNTPGILGEARANAIVAIGQCNLNPTRYGGLTVVIPPRSEQREIVLHLDHETAKIDALIAEQQRLIELLKEKRQAVISHAVTKGLNINAPMKDSSIEWLGEVPAHWAIVPTGYRYDIQLGRMLNAERSVGKDMRPYLRVADVQWGTINVEDLPLMDFPPDARERYRLQPGDLIVNEGGSYVGRSAIWRGELAECYYQKALHRVRARNVQNDTAEFLLFVMEFATKSGVFVAGGNQTTIDHLTAEQLRAYRFCFPPLSEQIQIVEFLLTETSRIDALAAEAEAIIALLQERRTAIISAAVTGKIDVRGIVPVESERELVVA